VNSVVPAITFPPIFSRRIRFGEPTSPVVSGVTVAALSPSPWSRIARDASWTTPLSVARRFSSDRSNRGVQPRSRSRWGRSHASKPPGAPGPSGHPRERRWCGNPSRAIAMTSASRGWIDAPRNEWVKCREHNTVIFRLVDAYSVRIDGEEYPWHGRRFSFVTIAVPKWRTEGAPPCGSPSRTHAAARRLQTSATAARARCPGTRSPGAAASPSLPCSSRGLACRRGGSCRPAHCSSRSLRGRESS